MRAALLAPLAILTATPAEARFAPKIGVDYRLVSTATSERDNERNTFTLVRSIRFARAPHGYIAYITVRSATSTGVPGPAAAFNAAYAAIVDLPLVIAVDRAGGVGEVRDADIVWQKLRDAMMREPSGHHAAAIFDAASPERRRALLGSALREVIAASDTERASGTRTLTIPARAVGGAGTDLPATETTIVSPNRIAIELDASGSVTAGASARLHRHRLIDRRTGFAIERVEEVITDIVIDRVPHRSRTIQTYTFGLAVP